MTTTRSARRTRGARTWWALLGFGSAVVVAAGIGVLGVPQTADEYANLRQPSWAPPSEVFGPVWSLLYALIAVAGWLAWRRGGFGPALWAWTAQLVLNAIWTPVFFGAGRYGLAFLVVVALWLLIGVTVALFWRLSRPAAALMLPYWAWVSFAAALNLAIWRMN
ncbi:tryptophan-rich sensory protein [Micromonospora sp. WMMD882]|uniref:TspO/MBR family protein n=1 Tax=Micromonospora sp. WMMD882 TaxID=3015151 RepID=UPI00248C04B3|nr:TspO/MBR family protein [Micromonospora sp. WMMD882]WBB79524.1 tryptophan-rich sensory protein [Micromonospora sp. WMMD882]